MALDFSKQAEPMDFSSQGEAMDFSSMGTPVESEKKEKAGFVDGLQDVARFFAPIATAGINAIGTAVGEGLAGGSVVEGLTKGAQSDKFLGMGLNMETDTGKFVEENMSKALEALRGFGAENVPNMLKDEWKRKALGTIPGLSGFISMYEAAPDELKTQIEGVASAAGASGPELLMTVLGGAGAKKLTAGGKPDLTIDDIVNDIRKEETAKPTGAPEMGDVKVVDPMAEGLNPQQWAEIQAKSGDLSLEPLPKKPVEAPKDMSIDFEKVDPATLRTQQSELPFADMDKVDFSAHATPEQGIAHVQTIPTDITPTKADVPFQASLDLNDRTKAKKSPNAGKFGQGGSIDPDVFKAAFDKLLKNSEDSSTTNNASGESAASAEAINRLKSQNEAGITMYEVDPNTNQLIPLKTADRVDKRAQKGKAIVQRDASGKLTIVENNSGFNDTALTNRSQYLINQEFAKEKGITLGGTGTKGFRQGGAINFGGGKEPPLEKQIRRMSKEDFRTKFAEKYPDYADRPDVADRVYDTFQQGSKKPSDFGKQVASGLDKGLGVLSTRIGNISQPVLHRAVKFEKNVLTKTHDYWTDAGDFMRQVNTLPENYKRQFDQALMNNDTEAINSLSKKAGIGDYAKVRKVLDDIGEQLKEIGRLDGLKKDYFPRIVTDVEGLKKVLGTEKKTALDQALYDAEARAHRRGDFFTDEERTKVINQFLRNTAPRKYAPGFSKNRVLDDIPEEFHQFYAKPTDALHSYIRNAVQEIETAKFFGKSAVKDPETGKLNVDQSIGAIVANELNEGKMDPNKAPELEDMLRSRFGPGNRTSAGPIQMIKDIANMGLIGNVVSTGTQLGDTAMSVYLNGLRPSLMAAVKLASNKADVSVKDFGLLDHISQEFVSGSKTAKALQRVFKYSGFQAVDRLGKEMILSSSLEQGRRAVRTPDGIKKFAEEWQPRFGDEFPQLVQDLQNGVVSEPVKTFLFSKLSKMQPISRLELPQKYLDMPNGRIVYMLKSFMIKQMDIVRNDAYNQIKQGNVRKGISNLARYAAIMGIAGASTQYIKDWMMGKEVDPELDDIPMNILKTFGWSEYVGEKVKRGAVGEAAGDMTLPPYKMFDQLFKDGIGAYKKEMGDDPFAKDPSYRSVNYLPVVGRLLYAWNIEEPKKESFRQQVLGEE